MRPTLLLTGTFALAIALVYLRIGAIVARRPLDPHDAAPWRAFAGWWFGVGANVGLTGVFTIVAAVGVTALPWFLVQAHVERLLLAVSLWCLLAYLTFIHRGDRRLWGPLVVYAIALWALTTYLLVLRAPDHVLIHAWARPRVDGSGTRPPLLGITALFLVVAPPVLFAALNLRLRRLIPDRARRRRITTLSAGIVVWILVATVAYELATVAWLQIVNRAVGLLAALAMFHAYRELRPERRSRSAAPPEAAP